MVLVPIKLLSLTFIVLLLAMHDDEKFDLNDTFLRIQLKLHKMFETVNDLIGIRAYEFSFVFSYQFINALDVLKPLIIFFSAKFVLTLGNQVTYALIYIYIVSCS